MYIKRLTSITELTADQWNGLLHSAYPFHRYEFLAALENTQAVGEASGWLPSHCAVYRDAARVDELIAIMPMYEKYNSNGEYIFDHSWANAFLQNGLDYYPKWVSSIPFTPCAGPRLLIDKAVDETEVFTALISYLKSAGESEQVSSWHCLYPEQSHIEQLAKQDFIIRETVQFRWQNRGYSSFDHYLASFSAKKRKNVRRERRWVKEQGIKLEQIQGGDITEKHWQAFYPFYQMTYMKRRMSPYLSLDFFKELTATMPAQLLLIMAVKDDVYVGAALSLLGDDTLYGRYWGCFDEYHSLHFEACYYQGLEYCIANNLKYFDSGAQGEHKISRGFEPVTTYSAHWIRHPQFSTAIERYVQQETRGMQAYKEEAAALLPYKKSV